MIQNNLGNVYRFLQQLDKAADCFSRALELQPDMTEAMNNLGNLRINQGKLHQAITLFQRIIDLNPQYAAGYVNLGNALKEQGRIDQALTQYQTALKYQPELSTAYSNYLMTLNYSTKTCEEIFEEHRHWGRIQPVTSEQAGKPENKQKLSIGYVSPDLHDHPVGFLMKPVLEHHDKSKFKVFCYSDSDTSNPFTKGLQASVDVWRDTTGMANQDVASQIKNDGVDILIDLSGHSANNRLQVFVEKPAHVQVTYLGYPTTTGLTQMDYIISDHWLENDNAENRYVEKLYSMDRPFFCYDSPEDFPAINPLPAIENGYPTFGSFNTFSKVSTDVIDLWAKILIQLPHAKIILQAKCMDDPETRQAVLNQFNQSNIAAERIALYGLMPFEEHLGLIQKTDITLDTFPWNGHMTTLNSLWMGVPVITLAGTCRAGRMGLEIMRNVQLDEFIADSEQAYCDKAIAAASDVKRLSELRLGMRERIKASPICDVTGFVSSLENAYLTFWQEKKG
jgi:predicted O-linked N-acetylglucosamine transferase (SPINDLY family)